MSGSLRSDADCSQRMTTSAGAGTECAGNGEAAVLSAVIAAWQQRRFATWLFSAADQR